MIDQHDKTPIAEAELDLVDLLVDEISGELMAVFKATIRKYPGLRAKINQVKAQRNIPTN